MRSLAILGVLVAAILLSGCARARVTTHIQSDGSWTRTIALSGQQKREGVETRPTLEDTFAVPTGNGWKSTDETKDNIRSVTLEHSFAGGATLDGDVSIKSSEPGKLRLVNHVTIKAAGPHQLEYREALHWMGAPSKILGDIRPEDLAKFKSYLPKPLATDANALALVDKMAELSAPVLFGPGDPLLAMGMLHPDLALYRLNQRVGSVMVKAMEQQFGDKMQPAERREVARQLIQESFSSSKLTQPDPAVAAAATSGNNPGLTPLMFIVQPPGKVVSTNGEIDEFSGEIFWALFEDAAAYKDVVMTAVLETN